MFFHNEIASYALSLDKSCIFVSQTSLNPTAPITGTFRMSLSHDTWIKNIYVRMTGLLKIPQDDLFISQNRAMLTFEQHHMLASSKSLDSFQLPAGDYELPFTIPLPARMLETLTGPKHEYHSYTVDAIVKRRLKKDLAVSRPIRIYKLPDVDSVDPLQWLPVTVDGHLDQSIQYCISIPNKHIPFGSTFPVECRFAPLSKNIKLRSVKLQVIEKHYLHFDATATESVRYNIRHVTTTRNHTVFARTYDLIQNSPPEEMEWQFKKPVTLPRTLCHCSQSLSTKNIQISHSLVSTAKFLDDQGQPAEVVETIPFYIYMTPVVVGEDVHVRSLEIRDLQGNTNPPPSYGKHVSDAIFATLSEAAGSCFLESTTNFDQVNCFRGLELPPYCE